MTNFIGTIGRKAHAALDATIKVAFFFALAATLAFVSANALFEASPATADAVVEFAAPVPAGVARAERTALAARAAWEGKPSEDQVIAAARARRAEREAALAARPWHVKVGEKLAFWR